MEGVDTLQDFYPVVFFDALRVKVKNGNTITPKALYLALAVRADGSREVLGMWLSDNEGGRILDKRIQ